MESNLGSGVTYLDVEWAIKTGSGGVITRSEGCGLLQIRDFLHPLCNVLKRMGTVQRSSDINPGPLDCLRISAVTSKCSRNARMCLI